jgi:hypothetical protein
MSASGLVMTVTVDDAGGVPRDISADITNIEVATPRGMQQLTGLGAAGVDRVPLRTDGQLVLSGVFNDAANMSHDVFKSVATAGVPRTVQVGVSGQTLTMELLFTEYGLRRRSDGGLIWGAVGALADSSAPAWS